LGKRNNALLNSDLPGPWLGKSLVEAGMTHMEIKALEDAGRNSMAWSTEGYDGQTHYADVLKALTPAFLILAAVAGLMLAIL